MTLPPVSSPVKWQVGEHVSIIGETGSGKTFLISQLVKLRQYVVILRTKPDDVKFAGFRRTTEARGLENVNNRRVLVDLTELRTLKHKQTIEAEKVLETVWRHGNWTLVVDEAYYVERKLGLGHELEMLATQGRSLGISLVCGMQRPAWVSRFLLSEPKHIFAFSVEGRDLATIAESTTRRIIEPVKRLPKYHFAHFYRHGRTIAVGEAHGIAKLLQIPPLTGVDNRR